MWTKGNFARLFQGFAVLLHYAIVLVGLTGVFGVGALYLLLLNPQIWPLLALYLAWVFVDWRTPRQGGRKAAVINFIGALFPFRCMRDYYPITLVKTADLDPERNYIFGYHPHGFMPDGLMISFGTNQLGFEQKFPGISPYIGSHSTFFMAPLYREIAMGLRLVDAGSESCRYILTQMGAGHSIALVPGGAAEMLDSCLGDYILTLNRRKQFIKMALETGSSLVPVFGFGQNDSFKIPSFANYEWLKSYKSSNTSLLKKWSKLMIKGIVISFSGKYIPGLPHNNPITVVVGSPIHVKRVTSPSDEQIDQLHTQYSMEIRRLFENNRNKYGVPSETKLIIQ